MARRSKKKVSLADLEGQLDPRAPLDWEVFLKAAAPVLAKLKDDLRSRVAGSKALGAALKKRHAAEKAEKRTADSFVAWRDHFIEQVAAAWVVSCVFVRTLEDRGLLGHARLAGPGAADSLRLFLELAPSLNERDYLLTVFRELTRFSATKALFDGRHNPVWLLAPSAEGAKALVQLFQAPHADEPAFRFGQPDTAFLGWIYQDLDEGVRKRFALLQTPRFVESFILDRTLEPAIAKFGLNDTTVVDPTCGSGHFLLGAFDRLYEHRLRTEPGLGAREAARKALDAVYGSDVNPYAVAIARFRLTLGFLDNAGFSSLSGAPVPPLHLAVADSLLHNPHLQQGHLGDLFGAGSAKTWKGDQFTLEDEEEMKDVLFRQHAAVVGNPPYINVKDGALRSRYADMYPSCRMNYALTVPFMERFFQLAKDGGRVGMITANSFMKREFGKKLVQEYLPTVNLDLVVNTSGAFIPGHGTPTVLLFGSNEALQGADVHTVLASRGEPSTPDNPEDGVVWRSIADHWNEQGFENEYVTVTRVAHAALAKHPWSLGGGGAAELKELLEERAEARLADVVADVGFSIIIGEDAVFLRPRGALRLRDLPTVPIVIGENVRDWSLDTPEEILRPFDMNTLDVVNTPALLRELWPWRTLLEGRIVSGSTSMKQANREWFDVRRLSRDKHQTEMAIVFAFVATHNHFVLDRGGKVFNRSAPIIKLPATATEDDHLALLAYLNSSTACFWMKQVFFDKGNRGEGGGTTAERWEKFFEHDGTKLASLPLPPYSPAQRDEAARRARHLSLLAERRQELLNVDGLLGSASDAAELEAQLEGRAQAIEGIEQEIRGAQESLDWWMYGVFGFVSDGVAAQHWPRLPAGGRASDVIFATQVVGGEVGRRYFDLCKLPAPETICEPAWTDENRLGPALAAIRESKTLGLLESPVFKRTFREGFRPLDWQPAARLYLAIQLERNVERAAGPVTARNLSIQFPESARVAQGVILGESTSAASILLDESIPFLAQYRFTDIGLDKHAEWERTWDLQRREDAGQAVGDIAVPSKYSQKDYRSGDYYKLRGPLDVPKERFISYPGCESDQDGEPVYGWAGWDHEQRARALATLYYNRKTEESWDAERLTPMLAGLLELLPWLKQWHDDASDDYGGESPARYYAGFLDAECRTFGLTHDDLRAWRPPEKKRGRGRRKKKE